MADDDTLSGGRPPGGAGGRGPRTGTIPAPGGISPYNPTFPFDETTDDPGVQDEGGDDPNPILPTPTEPTTRVIERVLTFHQTERPPQLIYGQVKGIGGGIFYQKLLSSGRLVVAYLIGYGPLESISNITVEEVPRFPGGLYLSAAGTDYEIFLGTSSQAVSSILSAADPNHVSRYPGLAYVVLSFKEPGVTIPAVDPNLFKCDVEGLKVRDPRTDPTLVNRYYRANPALAIADLMSSKWYGAGIPDANIDWSGSVTDSADFCDADIDPGAGTVKRFELGWVLREKRPWKDVLENLRAHAQLFVAFNSGNYQLIADQAKAASGIVYADNEIRDGATLRVKGGSEVPTHIVVRYADRDGKKDAVAEVEHPDIAVGTMERRTRTYELQGCPTKDQAKRTAIYLFNRSVQDKEVRIPVDASGIEPLPGDRVVVTSGELNLSNQDVILTDVEPDGIGWLLSAELYDPDVYDDTLQTETVGVNELFPSPYDPDAVVVDDITFGPPSIWHADDNPHDDGWIEIVPPSRRVPSVFGAASWTNSGFTTFDATRINDGLVDVIAASGGASAYVTLDCGSPKAFRHLKMTCNLSNPFGAIDFHLTPVEYSDNGIDWTSAVRSWDSQQDTNMANGSLWDVHYVLEDVGSHRYWNVAPQATIDIYEIQFYEFESLWPFLKEIRIFEVGLSTPHYVIPVSQVAQRVSGVGLPLLRQLQAPNGAGVFAYRFEIAAVSVAGVEGPKARLYIDGTTPAFASNLYTPSGGTINDLALPSAFRYFKFLPSADTTITGFNPLNQASRDEYDWSEGDRVVVHNTSTTKKLVLSHLNVGSAVDHRIRISSSADAEVPPESMALLERGSDGYWHFTKFHTAGDGSALQPSFSFDGDEDTGIFHPAADTIAFSTGGTERIRLGNDNHLQLSDDARQWGSVLLDDFVIESSHAALYFLQGSAAPLALLSNAYINNGYKFKDDGFAVLYNTNSGEHVFSTSGSSGLAGGAIVWQQSLVITRDHHVYLENDGDTYWSHPAPDTFRWTVGGSLSMNLSASGLDWGGGSAIASSGVVVRTDVVNTFTAAIQKISANAPQMVVSNSAAASTANEAYFTGELNSSTQVRAFGRIDIGASDVTDATRTSLIDITGNQSGTFKSLLLIDARNTDANPLLSGNADGNTGLRWPSADTLTVVTGGAERLRIDSSGNVSLAADIDTYLSHPAADVWRITCGGSTVIEFEGDQDTQLFGALKFRPSGTTRYALFDSVGPSSVHILNLKAFSQPTSNEACLLRFGHNSGIESTLALSIQDASGNDLEVTDVYHQTYSGSERSGIRVIQRTGGTLRDWVLDDKDSSDVITQRLVADANRNVVIGAAATLATNATNGFLYIPSCAGVPTGTPTAKTGKVPMVYDTTNLRLYIYSGGAWRIH